MENALTMSRIHLTTTISFLISILFAGALSAAETVLASGTWTKKSHKISGTWSIVDNGTTKEIRLKGFSTRKAPDLKLFFSPQTANNATNKNATAGSRLVVKLKAAKGDQTYAIPDGVDLSSFQSVLIHCERYSKLWGAADLR